MIKGRSLIFCFICLEEQSTEDKPYSLSLRRAFVASKGCLLIAADYSQIELRILAHLSKDRKLTQLLKKGAGDVFKSIAASWLSKPISQITIEERQRSKQICYGILYGMGPKALAEQLDGQDILEEQAVEFMATFKSAYPDVQTYIEDIICNCRKQVSKHLVASTSTLKRFGVSNGKIV